MSLEIRLHGRGGQGGVTCAKILAATYARLGKSVQTFGDYAGERSGAPVRAYTRVSDEPIQNRNKIYEPDHVLVLDPTLLDKDAVAGLARGGILLVNTSEAPAAVEARFGPFRAATIDATAIARRRGIGTRSVVIVNTTIAGAYARAADIPFEALERAYKDLHLDRDLGAAREAYDAVALNGHAGAEGAPAPAAAKQKPAETAPLEATAGQPVLPLTEHVEGPATGLKTGSWRTQVPRYVEQLPPCNAWCPAGNDVVGFIQAVAKDGEAVAAAILAKSQPFASVCGRVCPAPCMEVCNRRPYDGAVNIRGLERWIGDHATAVRDDVPTRRDRRSVAVVGSGPAGMTAACELARAGHVVRIYEGEASLGGVLRTGIPAYRLPREALDREIESILGLGIETRCGEFLDARAITRLRRQHDAVILAAGLGRPTELDVLGADLPGVEQGTKFLHRVNLEGGASLHGHVMVLGGGNTAIDCARSAIRSGASMVTVAYRRTRTEMPAIKEEIAEAEREGISFLYQRQPVAFHGRRRLTQVELAEVQMGEPDASGRRRPVVSARTARFECDYALLALGQGADPGLLPEGAKIQENRVHYDGGPTNLFVAGDFATNDGTVAHAIGDGRRAAARVLAALGEPATFPVPPDRPRAVTSEMIRFEHFPVTAGSHTIEIPLAGREASFEETNLGLSDPREAGRCFSCGRCTQCDTCMAYCPEGIIERRAGGYDVQLDFCKGCGICVTECPRHAMEMAPV
ncbi:MAG TPA: 2-oxoacid:acceptor oxidoreductase family protein [Candidatus Eisenbacteria bacterium]|nr:2-oxoacid:acceptor oxidoreductase family protein [Candidatus Eisenbacteria bacterium]